MPLIKQNTPQFYAQLYTVRLSPHLISSHAVAVEKPHLLVLLPSHVVHTLVSLNIPDLQDNTEHLVYLTVFIFICRAALFYFTIDCSVSCFIFCIHETTVLRVICLNNNHETEIV